MIYRSKFKSMLKRLFYSAVYAETSNREPFAQMEFFFGSLFAEGQRIWFFHRKEFKQLRNRILDFDINDPKETVIRIREFLAGYLRTYQVVFKLDERYFGFQRSQQRQAEMWIALNDHEYYNEIRDTKDKTRRDRIRTIMRDVNVFETVPTF